LAAVVRLRPPAAGLRTGGEQSARLCFEKCRDFVRGRAHQHSGGAAADWKIAATAKGFVADDEAEDVHHFVEKQLVRGSARWDTSCTVDAAATNRLLLICVCIAAAIDELRKELAEVCGLSPIVRSSGQRGDAGLYAFAACRTGAGSALVAGLCRDVFAGCGRLADCRKRLNVCPLGSGAIAGATLPLDRTFMADELDFASPTRTALTRPAIGISFLNL